MRSILAMIRKRRSFCVESSTGFQPIATTEIFCMNMMTFHKIRALAFVSIVFLNTGCSTYGGGPYGGSHGSGNYGAGTRATTSSADTIRNVGSLLSPTSGSFTGSASQSLRRLDMEAKRQEREARARQRKEQRLMDMATRQLQLEDMKKQYEEQREQKRAAYRAERAAREKAERERLALMTPEERKREAEIAKKRLELTIGILGGLMSGGGGSGSQGNSTYYYRDYSSSPSPAAPAPSTPNAFGSGYTTPAW